MHPSNEIVLSNNLTDALRVPFLQIGEIYRDKQHRRVTLLHCGSSTQRDRITLAHAQQCATTRPHASKR